MNEKSSLGQYLPWIAVAALAFMLWKDKAPTPDPKPDPAPTANVESITKQVLSSTAKAFSAAFEDAAKQVEAKQIKTDRELLEYVKPMTAKARLEANKPFDVMLETSIPNGSFEGQEADVAKLLRRIAKSWN